MRFFGREIRFSIRKSGDDITHWAEESGGWWPIIREGFAGAWQQNITIKRETLLAFAPVYGCVNRIVTDIAKMPLGLMEKTEQKIWVEVERNSPFLTVINKPCEYQTQSQFLAQWMISKLLAGNTYGLKLRDNRGVVIKIYVLDPTRVRPLITPDGSVYYQLGHDPLSEIYEGTVVAPASEIIHDRMPGLFHPLIGTSPIFACALPAAQGHSMQRSSAAFFRNMAQPSGVLTAPGAISDPTAERLKKDWGEKFGGSNAGKVAVLGDGLKFEPMTMTAQAAQAVEQLKITGEMVCTAFGVPAFMVGVGPPPSTIDTVEGLTQQYWGQCLQYHIENFERCYSEGIGLKDANVPLPMMVKLAIDVLLKMDTASRYEAYKNAIGAGWMSPNEARRAENLPPVKGGETPYLQVQNYSLAALSKRDQDSLTAPANKPDTNNQPSDGANQVKPPDSGSASDGSTDGTVKMLPFIQLSSNEDVELDDGFKELEEILERASRQAAVQIGVMVNEA